MKPDILALGECLIEFSLVAHMDYRQAFSGDVLNSLFYASKLGLRSELLTTFGSDPFTVGLQSFVKKCGIGTAHTSVTNLPNGVYFITPGSGVDRAFHYLRRESAARSTLERFDPASLATLIDTAEYFLFSAIALAVMRRRDVLLRAIKQTQNALRLFDINYRPVLWDDPSELRELLPELAASVDLLFVSESDHSALYGESLEPAHTLQHYRELGFNSVVLRCGSEGSFTFEGETLIHVPAYPTAVMDSTGAGDAFNAGYIYGRKRGYSIREQLAAGNAAASFAVEVCGGIAEQADFAQFETRKSSLLAR